MAFFKFTKIFSFFRIFETDFNHDNPSRMKYRNYYCSPKYSDGDKCYYGDVDGVPEIETIEAATIDDFERLFHQAVDDYLGRKSFIRPEKRNVWVPILVAAAVIFLALVTCPDKGKHSKVLSEQLNSVVAESISTQSAEVEALGMLFSGPIIKTVLNNYLIVDDYFLFSIGRFSYQGEETTVSFGAFGHVFTSSREKMKEKLKEKLQ